MKTYINKINKYLLERYPTIWNTKLVWMLGIAAVIHILFFVLGFVLFTNTALLHERGASSLFFENGTVFFSVMITLILLVIWLSQLFKNNAFKNFYPTNRWRLFGQFFQYFIIILVSSTFYYSYSFGVKSYINLTYPDTEFAEDVDMANDAAVFLSHDIRAYTIKNRKYPQPFDSIYCETRETFINYDQSYFNFYGNDYQFYSLSKKTRKLNENFEPKFYQGYVFTKDTDSTTTYYFRDAVLNNEDVYINYTNTRLDSTLIYTPTYYNFSGRFFDIKNNSGNSLSYYMYTQSREAPTEDVINANKKFFELLQRNDKQEISSILDNFLALASKFNIKGNLDIDTWKSIVFKKEGFQISKLIQDEYPKDLTLFNTKEKTEYEKYIESITTKYYIESEKLFYVFDNINDMKKGAVLNESIHVFIWIAFFLAALIFTFRISSVRVFIFSIVTSALLLIFIGLIMVFLNYALYQNVNSEYFNFSFMIIIGFIILAIPFLLLSKIRKSITGIFMNISIVGFPILLLMIVTLISTYQRDLCFRDYDNYSDCPNIFSSLEFLMSYTFLFLSFLFIFLYTGFIKKWRALPEK